MLKNGTQAVADITGYTSQGDGVCRIEDVVVFVPGAIAGERCRVRVTKVGKTAAWGKIEEILEKSPHRVPRACPVAKLCGGCQFWHMDYAEELSMKAHRVAEALRRIGGVEINDVPITGATAVEGYRNKAQYPVAPGKNGPVAGFYRQGTHQVVPMTRCRILPPVMDKVKAAVLSWMHTYKVSAYEEATGRGLVRHIYVRQGFGTGQLLVCLVANGSTLPHPEALLSRIRQAAPALTSLVLSVNQKPGNRVLGDKLIPIYGPGEIEDVLCGLRFRLSPLAFYQVNHDQAQRLYAAALAAAGLTAEDTVLDLYCGVGTITQVLAQKAGRAIGVEVVPQAIEDAKANARRNGLKNVEFFCADAGQAAQRLAQQGLRPQVVVVDPPRKGLSPQVIQELAQMCPQRIVYVSCDPATLARDVRRLGAHGYALTQAQAFDLFPRCAHVETVCSLVLRKPVTHINIDVDVEELVREKRG